MNNDHFSINFRPFSTLIILVVLIVTISPSTSSLRPIYPCHYKDLNQRIYKCDMCTCLLSPPLFSTSNFCSPSSSSLSTLICSDNSTKNSNENLLRSRLDEIESESDHQQYSPLQERKLLKDIQFEFDYFNDQTIQNLFNTDEFCSTLNSSRVTFYRLQSNTSFNPVSPCSLNIFSLRFLDSTIDNSQLFQQINPEILIFYNTTLALPHLNLTSTSTLAFYYVKFLSKPFVINSLSSLIHLTITHTSHFDILGSYPNLIYLDLCHTQLNDIQLNKFFSQIDMPDLITLILSNNYISILKTKFPSTIRYLDLSNNQIKSLDYTSFKSLYSLNTLNLSYNAPLDIQQDTFTRIPYLEILDLTSIQPSSPIEDLFLPLQKLRHLNLSSNQLNSLPRLPVPYDAHTIASYDHHLPVLYVDMSHNSLTQIDFEIFSSASTQDKYIISLDLSQNQLKTLQFPSSLSSGIKRRGPLLEMNVNNNPLQCDCILYENLFPFFQNDFTSQQQNSFNRK